MPHTQHPVSPEQLAANRVNAAKSTGPRTPQGKARSTQNARKHGFTASTFAVERIALAQQAIFRAARLEAGLFTTCLNEVLDDRDTPLVGLDPDMVGDLEITRAQNRNYLLGEGFHRMASKSNSWSLFLRYQAQAERHGAPSGPRAVEEFERLKALREELPNEAILEAQPEQTETTCTPSETNPSPPEDPAPAPDPPPRSPNWSWISPALRVFWKTPKSKRATQITRPPHRPQAPLSEAKPGACQNNAPGKRL